MNSDAPTAIGGESRTRILPIPGSHNLRDMGGYPAIDGRHVKWGTLFRSGVMHGLTDADRAEFRQLGITTIFDLRTTHERTRRPTEWHHGHNVDLHARDYELSLGDLTELLAKIDTVPDVFGERMRGVYVELPFEQAESYRTLFRLLVEKRVPLLFNCTAGKDRTGVAAALILYALGVPRETIEHDYLLTELALEHLIEVFLSDPRYAVLKTVPREFYLPLLQADPAYLPIAFQEIERRYGSVEQYLETVLGVGATEIAILRETLLD